MREFLLLAVFLLCNAGGDGAAGSPTAESNPDSAFAALFEEDGAERLDAGGHRNCRVDACVTGASMGFVLATRPVWRAPGRTLTADVSAWAACGNATLLTVIIPCAGLGTRVGLPYP